MPPNKSKGLPLVRTAGAGALIAFAALTLLAWCVRHHYTIDEQAKAVGIAKDILTIVALSLGGIWSLRIYVTQRAGASAIDVKQDVLVIALSNSWLLKVSATIRNVGKTRVQLSEWQYRADLLHPLSPNIDKEVWVLGAFSEAAAPWPQITGTTLSGEEFGFFIEPGATQVESANIMLPRWVEAVQVYSYFSGPSGEHGWWDRSFIDLRKEGANGNRATTEEGTTG